MKRIFKFKWRYITDSIKVLFRLRSCGDSSHKDIYNKCRWQIFCWYYSPWTDQVTAVQANIDVWYDEDEEWEEYETERFYEPFYLEWEMSFNYRCSFNQNKVCIIKEIDIFPWEWLELEQKYLDNLKGWSNREVYSQDVIDSICNYHNY